MAGKSTQLTLKVAAVNATSRVFRSIASSALGVTKSIAKWGSVAAVAAGGAFAVTANKLSKLSDTRRHLLYFGVQSSRFVFHFTYLSSRDRGSEQ